MEKFLPQHSCFASFDFTPEDVFLTLNGLKYADPLPNLVGIPIVDIACFSGVAHDAYSLPGSTTGYELMKKFSLEIVPQIIGLKKIRRKQSLFLAGLCNLPCQPDLE